MSVEVDRAMRLTDLAKRLHAIWETGFNESKIGDLKRTHDFDDMLPEAKQGWLKVAEVVESTEIRNREWSDYFCRLINKKLIDVEPGSPAHALMSEKSDSHPLFLSRSDDCIYDCIWCGHPELSHTAPSAAKLGRRCEMNCNCAVYEGVADVKQHLLELLKSFTNHDPDVPIALQGAGLVNVLRARCEQLSSDVKDANIVKDSRPEPPISMLLWCPACGARHIDEGAFATKPHHTHACQNCGVVWRPAIVPTVGVHFLPGFKNL